MSLQILGGASKLLETLFRDTTLELSWTVQTLFWLIGVYNGCASFLGLLIPDIIQEELAWGTHRFNSSTYLWSVAQVKPFASMGTWVWLCGVPGVVGLMLWWFWCYPQNQISWCNLAWTWALTNSPQKMQRVVFHWFPWLFQDSEAGGWRD